MFRFNFELKTEYFGQGRLFILHNQLLQLFYFLLAVYKTGKGEKGQERWDMCVGTWDLGTSSIGGGDIKYRDAGTLMINGKVGGKCDILFFVEMCFLLSTLDFVVQKAHWTHYDVFTKCIPCYPR